MPIVYAVIARGTTVLAEHTLKNTHGNFLAITRQLLKVIKSNDTKATVICQSHAFHYVVEGGVTYMCMAEKNEKQRIPFKFLKDIKSKFQSSFDAAAIRSEVAFGMNRPFKRVLTERMTFYNDDPNADRFRQVKGQINEVKGIIIQDIEKVLIRGEKLDLLVDKTEELSHTASKFKKTTKRVRNAMWWKNCRMRLIIAVALVLVLYFILALACGGPSLPSCR